MQNDARHALSVSTQTAVAGLHGGSNYWTSTMPLTRTRPVGLDRRGVAFGPVFDWHKLFGLGDPVSAGFFLAVYLGPNLRLDYAEPGVDFPGQHYAFLGGEEDFDG